MKGERGWGMGEGWGVTIVEVMVVLAVLGLTVGIGGAALGSLDPTRESKALAALRRARAEAIRTGRPVRTAAALFFPDGTARGPEVDLLTGGPRAQP